MISGGGLTLQISEIAARIILDEFLVDARIRAIGQLEDSINNEEYDYFTILDALATPWRQDNPVRTIGYAEGIVKIADTLMIYPVDRAVQQSVKLLPKSVPAIFYINQFVVQGNLSMGQEMALSGVMEGITRRFLVLTNASLFPLFPARVSLPEVMPVILLNRARVSHYHAAAD